MDTIISPTPQQVSNAVLSLAEAFGLTASVFTLVRKSERFDWQNGRMDTIESAFDCQCHVILWSPDGRVGQAVTSDWSIPSAERALHLARQAMRPDPSRIAQLDRLAALEKRCPPVLPAGEATDGPKEALAASFSARHQAICSRLSVGFVKTAVTLSRELYLAARSDGAVHQTSLWRVRLTDAIRQSADTAWRQVHSGLTVPEPDLPCPDQLALALPAPDGRWAHPADKPGGAAGSGTRHHQNLLVDSAVLARLLFAWFRHSGKLPPSSAATLRFEPVEGSPGYTPIHPWGYLAAPATLCSANGSDPVYLHALRHAPAPFAGHLSLELAPLADPAGIKHVTEAYAALAARKLVSDDTTRVLEGVDKLYVDPSGKRFALLPTQAFAGKGGQLVPAPAGWLHGSLDQLLLALVGGAGPGRIEWGDPQTDWTAALPAYALLRPREGGNLDAAT